MVNNVQLGDVVLIPSGGLYYTCKIIWVSKRSKDVIGMVILPGIFESSSEAAIEDGGYRKFNIMGRLASVVYGDKKNITKRNVWKIIGSLPLKEEDKQLIIHEIGGGLYKGDEYLGSVSDEDRGLHQKMLVAGNAAIENFLKNSASC